MRAPAAPESEEPQALDVAQGLRHRRDAVVASILSSASEIAERRGVSMESAFVNSDPPATSGPAVVQAAAEAAKQMGLQALHMVSRAYHDTLFMATPCPSVGMIFIPCLGGYSHRPDEFASDQDMANGVAVLALTMAKLSLA